MTERNANGSEWPIVGGWVRGEITTPLAPKQRADLQAYLTDDAVTARTKELIREILAARGETR